MLRHIVLMLLLVAFPPILSADGNWQLVVDDNGVALYTRVVKGQSTSEFKGVCFVDRPIEAVGATLLDFASYPKWVFRCRHSYKIPAKDSSELHYLLYVAIDTPWPFADRDAVYKVVTTIDDARKTVVVRSTALKTQPIEHRKNHVRITDSELQWILAEISDARTRITFINRTNAAGRWAEFISNSGTRATTLHSLKNLKRALNSGSFAQGHQ